MHWRSPVSLVFSILLLGAPVAAYAQALPPEWTATDVGAPALRGSATVSSQTYAISAAGTDIWGAADQFTFVHRTLTGDGTIVARVASIEAAHAWTKAGVMMRESLAPGSRHAFALVSASKGTAFQRRSGTSKSSTNTSAPGAAPAWIRIQRRGTSFTASRSADGIAWSTIATQTISMPPTILVGLAVTSHNASARATATFANVSVSSAAAALPAGWQSSDIGAVGVPGDAAYDAGRFTIGASGQDIWNTFDQFRFTYQQARGDVDIVARVDSVEDVDPWTKAGVMIRGSLNPASAHASMIVSAGKGVAFQRRPSDGAPSLHTAAGGRAAPWWVRLSRRGSTITAFQSADGSAWSAVGTQHLTLPDPFYVGLAVTSHDAYRAASAGISGVSIQTPVVIAQNEPPAVTLTSPAATSSAVAPATIALAASAGDPDGTISRVDFYAGAALVGSDASLPYTFAWPGVPAGTYVLTAVAYDDLGAAATSASSTVTVAGGNLPPAVTLDAPSAGANVAAPASITLTASASDSDGRVARVEFYANSALIGSDATAPYSLVWSAVPAGSYSLVAVARDQAGATTVSSARSLLVQAPQAPGLLMFTPSTNHATAVSTYVVEFFPAGADPAVANAVATLDAGKPALVNGECQADVRQIVAALAPGSYVATVTAMGPGGSARSLPSPAFAR